MPKPNYYIYVEFKTGGGKMYEVTTKLQMNNILSLLDTDSLSLIKIVSGFTLETRVSEDD